MILARVCGNLVVSHKESGFDSLPLRIVQKVSGFEDVKGGLPFVVIDRIGAGDGQYVLLETSMESSAGMRVLCASDAAIVAIVDKVVSS